jgi:DNA replicative helicase MCM subunit Mcm2 (Cdc46/Mcm family)
MERLWKLQSNEFHDVRIDEDRQSSSSSSSSKKKNQLPPIDSLCMQYLVRLHAFFFAFLQKHSARPSDGAGCNGETEEEEDDEDDEHVEEEKNGNSVSRIAPSSVSSLLPSSSSFLKQSPKESCLESFCSLFVDGSGGVCLRGGRRVLTIHYDEFMQELNTFEFRGKEISDEIKIKKSFAPYLHHFPNRALPALNVSMALATLSVWRRNNRNLLSKSCGNNTPDNVAAVNKANSFLDSSQVIVRLVNVAPVLPMADVKTGLVGKFISVKGHVVKARHRKLRVATADFTCQKCASLVPYSFEKGIFSLPTKCSNKDCKSRSFTLIRPTARYTNVQELRLQEIQEESTSHAGRTPRQTEVELTNDLIDSCRPGDIVLLACFVDAVNSATAAGRTGKRAKETSTYKLFLQGHSITTLSETNHQNGGGGGVKSGSEGSQVTYTQLQLQNITQLCHADHRCLGMIERRAFPFDLLVRSLCPSIIGHHAVKAGILLCLLGGTPPASQQLDRGSSIRSNSHILIVGDPGTFCKGIFCTCHCT